MSSQAGQSDTQRDSDESDRDAVSKSKLSGKNRQHKTNPTSDRLKKVLKRCAREGWRNTKTFGHWFKKNSQPILVVATILILLVYRGQLSQMQKSTDAAKVAARLARKSIKQVERNARLDQRAWVTTSSSQLAKPLAVGEKPEVTVSIINSGKTPARNVITGGDADISEKLSESDISFNPITNIVSKFVLAPGVTAKTVCYDLRPVVNQDEIDNLKNGQGLRLYVRGTITYEAVFGRPHRTTFCVWINGKELKGTMHSCDFGNTAD
jgi:hypothetical protein